MNVLNRVEGGGHYGDLTITGKDERSRNNDTGLIIFVPEGEIAHYGDIRIENTYNPIIKLGKGLLTYNSLDVNKFGGDVIQIRGKSYHCSYTRAVGDTPTRPYSVCIRSGEESIEECLARHHESVWDPSILSFETHPDYPHSEIIMSGHVDVCQPMASGDRGWPLEAGGIISDIKMPNIIVRLDDPRSQLFMASEPSTIYEDLELGTERLDVEMKYPYAFSLLAVKNSSFGCDGAKLNGAGIRIREVKPRDKCIPKDLKLTGNNQIKGFDPASIIEECAVDDAAKQCKPKPDTVITVPPDEVFNPPLPAKSADDIFNMALEAMKMDVEAQQAAKPMSHTKLMLITALGMSEKVAEKWAEPLDKAAAEFGITTDKRFAGWLAQMAHESMNFHYTEEIWGDSKAQQRYDIRTDLGNTPERDGDGKANKGVGPLQITGNDNLTACAIALRIPRDEISERLTNDPLTGARGAGWWWRANNANQWADQCNITAMSGLVNCGNPKVNPKRINHLAERKQKYTAIIRFMKIHEKAPISDSGTLKEKAAQVAKSRGVRGVVTAAGGTGVMIPILSSVLDEAVKKAVADPVGSVKSATEKAGEVTESFGMLARMIGVTTDNYVSYLKYGLIAAVAVIILGVAYAGYARLDDMATGKNP